MLCLHYLAVIRYNIKDEVLKKYELYMHLGALLIPLTSSVIGSTFDIFGVGRYDHCSIKECEYVQEFDPTIDLKCDDSTPVEEFILSLYRILIPTGAGLAFITIIVSMSLIFHSVYSQTTIMKQYYSFNRRNSTGIRGVDNGGGNGPTTTNNGSDDNRRTSSSGGVHHETLIQSSLYVVAYLLTYPIATMITVIRWKHVPFALSLLKAILFPLQGFWNFLIYFRPRYITARDATMYKSFWWIVTSLIFLPSRLEEEQNAKRRQSRLDIIGKGRKNSRDNCEGDDGRDNLLGPNVNNTSFELTSSPTGNDRIDPENNGNHTKSEKESVNHCDCTIHPSTDESVHDRSYRSADTSYEESKAEITGDWNTDLILRSNEPLNK